MAANFYAQILRGYRWDDISEALHFVIRHARRAFEQPDFKPEPGHTWHVQLAGIGATAEVSDDDESVLVASMYLGSVMNHIPSGRFYAPWSAVPESVRDRDARWWEALERVAARYGLSVTNGEGDPTDILIQLHDTVNDDVLAAALMPDDIGAK